MILLIDNYDSFVFNLARYFELLGQPTLVVRNDAIDVAGVQRLNPQAVVISPGPCAPQQAGCSLDVIRRLHDQLPLLGVCLGHQALAEALGGEVIRAPEPVHGRTSVVYHNRQGIFDDLPNPLTVCRYHSLIVRRETLPEALQMAAETADGVIMALQHHERPVFGVQFHPEAILTEQGLPLLANFLRLAGINVPAAKAQQRELLEPPPARPLPTAPVTF